MTRLIFLLLSTFTLASCFMVEQPKSSGNRIRNTERSVATAEPPTKVETRRSSITTRPVSGKPMITQINSVEDYKAFLNEDDRLCMVKFYAPYCKSCQKFGMQFERIGKEIGPLKARNQDGTETVVREGEIRLAEIEYGANKELCKSLNIKKLPTVHFYSQGKLVEGFPCGPRKINVLLEKLMRYRSMSLPELDFEAEMNRGLKLGKSVVESLKWEYEHRGTKEKQPML